MITVCAATARLVERLEAVTWLEDLSRTGSRVRLMKEYLRRSALWTQASGGSGDWPFYDIAACTARATPIEPGLLDDVIDRLGRSGAGELDRRVARFMIAFAALEERPVDLPDPYEPLLMMFERGGGFHREAGSIRIGYTTGIPQESWQVYARREPYDITDASLDARDDLWLVKARERVPGFRLGE